MLCFSETSRAAARPTNLLRLFAISADLVPVGVADVGDVVAAVGGPGAGLAVIGAAVGEGRGVKLLDRALRARRERDHRAVAGGRGLLVVGFGDEELRLVRRAFRGVAEVALAVAGPREA